MEKKHTAGYIKIDFDDEEFYTYLPIPGYIPDIDILSERMRFNFLRCRYLH
jgi:hypothetical protein